MMYMKHHKHEYFYSFVDKAKEFTMCIHFRHEGICIDIKFKALDQFLEFTEKIGDLGITIATKNKEKAILNEGIMKTVIVQKRIESTVLLSYENENLTQRDNTIINSLLKQHVSSFLISSPQEDWMKNFHLN